MRIIHAILVLLLVGSSNSLKAQVANEDISEFTKVREENSSYLITGQADVAYGADGVYVYKYNQSGWIKFDNATFGDPIPGVYKSGYIRSVKSSKNQVGAQRPANPLVNNLADVDDGGKDARSGATIFDPGYYKLINVHSGKVLGLRNGNVQLSEDDGSRSQMWEIIKRDPISQNNFAKNNYIIRNLERSGDLKSHTFRSGEFQIDLMYTKLLTGTDFEFTETSDGNFFIKGFDDGIVLNSSNLRHLNGFIANPRLKPKNNTFNKGSAWKLVKVATRDSLQTDVAKKLENQKTEEPSVFFDSSHYFTIRNHNKNLNMALDVSIEYGDHRLELSTIENKDTQKWRFVFVKNNEHGSGSVYRLVNKSYGLGKSLSTYGEKSANWLYALRDTVDTIDANNMDPYDEQLWLIVNMKDGGYSIGSYEDYLDTIGKNYNYLHITPTFMRYNGTRSNTIGYIGWKKNMSWSISKSDTIDIVADQKKANEFIEGEKGLIAENREAVRLAEIRAEKERIEFEKFGNKLIEGVETLKREKREYDRAQTEKKREEEAAKKALARDEAKQEQQRQIAQGVEEAQYERWMDFGQIEVGKQYEIASAWAGSAINGAYLGAPRGSASVDYVSYEDRVRWEFVPHKDGGYVIKDPNKETFWKSAGNSSGVGYHPTPHIANTYSDASVFFIEKIENRYFVIKRNSPRGQSEILSSENAGFSMFYAGSENAGRLKFTLVETDSQKLKRIERAKQVEWTEERNRILDLAQTINNVPAENSLRVGPELAITENVYFRLSNRRLGDGLTLDVRNNDMSLAPTREDESQIWKAISIGREYYQLMNKLHGDERSLEAVNEEAGRSIRIADTWSDYGGQRWKFTPVGNGFYRLTTQWYGEERSLSLETLDGGALRNHVVLEETRDH